MPLTDPIGDMLTRMRNAQHARNPGCSVASSKILRGICDLLKREGYLASVTEEGEDARRTLTVTFHPKKTIELKRVSTPGRRIYVKASDVKPHLQGFGIAVISTSQGLLTDKEAREKKIGGELICTIAA